MTILPDFADILFPVDISYGAQSSSRFKTDITIVQSGYEKRIANWQDSLHEFNISHNIKNEDQIIYLKKLYQQVRGPLISFKFKDWSDYKCEKNFEGIGNEDGKFSGYPYVELWKKYEISDEFDFYSRRIKLIVNDSEVDQFPFSCYIDNIIVNNSNYTIDKKKGLVYFQPIKKVDIVNITKATNAIVTTLTNHNFVTDDNIYIDLTIYDGILNKKLFKITVIDSTTFYLNYNTNSMPTDSTGGKAYYYRQDLAKFTWSGEFYVNVRFSEDIATINIDDNNTYSFPCKLTEIRG